MKICNYDCNHYETIRYHSCVGKCEKIKKDNDDYLDGVTIYGSKCQLPEIRKIYGEDFGRDNLKERR